MWVTPPPPPRRIPRTFYRSVFQIYENPGSSKRRNLGRPSTPISDLRPTMQVQSVFQAFSSFLCHLWCVCVSRVNIRMPFLMIKSQQSKYTFTSGFRFSWWLREVWGPFLKLSIYENLKQALNEYFKSSSFKCVCLTDAPYAKQSSWIELCCSQGDYVSS